MIKTTIKIDGMACGMCEAHVNDALRKVIKAKKITSSHKKKEAVVVSENELNEEEKNNRYKVLDIKTRNLIKNIL